ncbi:unnamed protein product [Vitrella brassicaformis CCMP3155]|uniref:Uncharacterized protein n=2 Tax=Vitrella brassicaformis TaxID=1169539 RepID=A0A0G4G6Y1_VITBC|nr:unnamed protein product [Vitrella brassicaformis CCMP3155]|mmetsp:Transcript_25846/g.64160  ORF Transcript_25846/g.64160 Transcript_25846/m.64160 type:complete len:300 (+) Transcript_25846:142-1041(+)|eukprot:CEM24375.1 unnamed protein product [Vitrella brassicaformis CCMP3155]
MASLYTVFFDVYLCSCVVYIICLFQQLAEGKLSQPPEFAGRRSLHAMHPSYSAHFFVLKAVHITFALFRFIVLDCEMIVCLSASLHYVPFLWLLLHVTFQAMESRVYGWDDGCVGMALPLPLCPVLHRYWRVCQMTVWFCFAVILLLFLLIGLNVTEVVTQSAALSGTLVTSIIFVLCGSGMMYHSLYLCVRWWMARRHFDRDGILREFFAALETNLRYSVFWFAQCFLIAYINWLSYFRFNKFVKHFRIFQWAFSAFELALVHTAGKCMSTPEEQRRQCRRVGKLRQVMMLPTAAKAA